MTWGLRLACVHRASPPHARISITRHPLMMADEALAECRSGHPISPEASGMGEGFSHVAVSFTPPHRVQGVRVRGSASESSPSYEGIRPSIAQVRTLEARRRANRNQLCPRISSLW